MRDEKTEELEDAEGGEENITRLEWLTLGEGEAEESRRLALQAGLEPGPKRAAAVRHLVEASGLYRREIAERIRVLRSDLYMLMRPDFMLPLPPASLKALIALRDELGRNGRLASLTEERYYRAVISLFGTAAPRKREREVFTRIREVAEATSLSERNVRRHLPPYPKSVKSGGSEVAFRPARKLTEQLEQAAAALAPRLSGAELDDEVRRVLGEAARLAAPARATRRRAAQS